MIMVGDAADDLRDWEKDQLELEREMARAGCRRCPLRELHTVLECPVCHDLGWINANGEPCEP